LPTGRNGTGQSSSGPVDPSPADPLRIPKRWNTKNGQNTWTRKTLDNERRAFFETRVTGRPEIWGAIQSALEVLWQGGDPGDTDGGLGTAHYILEAAEITVPNGDLTKRVYDRFGASYDLPRHIVSDPQNLAPSPEPSIQPGGAGGGSNEEGESEELDEDEILRRREEKGKDVLNEADLVDVRVRFSNPQPDKVVRVGQDVSVRLVVRQIVDEIGVSCLVLISLGVPHANCFSQLEAPKRIRLNYMGRLLEDKKSLKAQGWNGTDIINALVFDK